MNRIERYSKIDDETRSMEKEPLKKEKENAKARVGDKKPTREQNKKDVCGAIQMIFQVPIFKLLPKIKDHPYFVWPHKMGRDPSEMDQSLH